MSEIDQWITNLESMLKIEGSPIDEGKKDNRNSLGTGSVRDWLTYPGDVYVKPDDENYIGDIIVHFTGRERIADYVTGLQRDTNDHQTSGKVTATYEFTFGGNLMIVDAEKHGGRGRVGNAIVTHIQGLNGASVND